MDENRIVAVADKDDAHTAGRSNWIVPLIAALVFLTPLIVFVLVALQGPQLEREAYAGLEIAARLKAQQVESWFAERRGDGKMIQSDPDLIQHIANFQARPDEKTRAQLTQRLDALRHDNAYPAIYLLNPAGEKLLVRGEHHDLSAQTLELLPHLLRSGELGHSDLYLEVNDKLAAMNFIVPLRRKAEGGEQVVAALVLHAEPTLSMFPMILEWPSASPSGETLLVRREGDSVVFLNQLRHVRDTALKLRRPVTDPLLPAAIAVRATEPGRIRGQDYRGMDVLAVHRPIAGTDWHLVAKIEYDEVMAPMWRTVGWVGLLAFASILLIGVLLRLFWLQQTRLLALASGARSAQALRESEARFRAVAETARDAIVTADARGIIVGWNSAATRMFGFTEGEIVGQSLTSIIPQRFHQRAMDSFYRMLDGDPDRMNGTFAELTGRRKDDSDVLLERSVALWETAAGRFYTCTMRDITDRKQQEERTRQLLLENETILNSALVGIVFLRQRRIVSCNRRFEEIFQYGPGELIGESSARLYDTNDTYVSIGDRAYPALGEGRSFSEEVLLRHKDGSMFWGALNGRAVDPARPNDGSIWVYADISERRRAEQETSKLLRAVEQSPASIVITSREGAIEYVNPSFTRITGYTRSEVLGQNPRILRTEETPVATYQELWNTILSGETWQGVLHNRCKNGDLIWEDTSISPIVGEDGEITHFVAVKEDVTERKRIEQQLETHQAHLEDLVVQRTEELSAALDAAKLADRSKDEFLANITHELRTPLSAVIGFSSLARPLSTDTRQREYLDKVNSAGKTLSGIIDDLLDLSKIAAGRMEFEAAPFSLRQLVGRTRSVISYKAQEKGLQLVERIADEVPDVLIGDPLRLEQILINLLSNAVKFTAAGRVELRIGVIASEAQRVGLCIDIEDTGIGLSEEGISLLFKPFSQTDASMTRKFGGTGLGLAICKRLAELMDGDISVTSREGAGSTFHVRLWFGLGQASDLPAVEESPAESAQVRYQDVRVLVVDDQPFNRDVVEGLLAAVGITPHLAEDGQQAVDAIALGSESFDLVLMDVQMPIMDGLTATRVIRKLDGVATLPIIAMTAHTMAHEKEKGVAAGMNDHIGKPFDEAGFYRVLAKWIPRSKQRRQAVAATPAAAALGLPSLPGVDVRAGLALLQGNEVRYRQWLGVFVAEMPVTMAKLREALAAGQSESASMSAHTLKGRTGLLGMSGLHAISAALEAAIDAAQPTSELLLDLEHDVAAMCEEIRKGLALEVKVEPAATPDALPKGVPSGPPPGGVARLIAALNAGDSDCEEIIIACRAELKHTAWDPLLEQALAHVRKFDFAAAGSVLAKGSAQ